MSSQTSERSRLSGAAALACLAFLVFGCAGGSSVPTQTGATQAATGHPAATSQAATPTARARQDADDGAHVASVTGAGGRAYDLLIDSPAVGIVTVRIVLPLDFDALPDATWPTLYLLHGAGGNHEAFTEHVVARPRPELSGLLIVQPDGGEWGFYSDWWNGGHGGQPMWETFHLTELPQILERNWRAGDQRAVAGISMGGYGAIEYAARRPGYFRAAASISGPLALTSDSANASEFLGALGAPIDDVWGDIADQSDIWAAHDPWVNAANLEGTQLFISYGNGESGPLDRGWVGVDDLEAWIAAQDDLMVDRLAELEIEATIDAYGPGTHSGPYFGRAFDRALPILSEALHAP